MRHLIHQMLLVFLTGASASLVSAQQPKPEDLAKIFDKREVMIPVRDGVRLETVIIAPVEQKEPLPILFRRTPYGVPEKAPEQMPSSWKELMQDGYIMVIQNLRGRFKSEGTFVMTRPARDPKDPKAAVKVYWNNQIKIWHGIGNSAFYLNITMLNRNGVNLYYETHGEGPVILLTHGYSATSQMWRGQIGPFQHGLRVRAVVGVDRDADGHVDVEGDRLDLHRLLQ